MIKKSRTRRIEVLLSPQVLQYFPTTRAAWYETPSEIEAGLAWGKEKARLLRWVRRQMARRLTQRECRCIELYFFNGLTYRDAAGRTKRNASSVYRGVQRAIRKLRRAALTGRVPGCGMRQG